MSIKKTAFLVGALICTALPLQVQAQTITTAEGLRITNNTDFDSTSKINGLSCSSSVLGESGITRAHSTNEVSNGKIRVACALNRENCKADVYMSTDCEKSGKPRIATVILSVNTGIKEVNMNTGIENPYIITYSGFTATISPK